MGKKLAVVILGLCIVALGAADVYLYMSCAQSDKVKAYSEAQSEETEKKDKKQETESQAAESTITSMNGFALGSQGIAGQKPEQQDMDIMTNKNQVSNTEYILPDSDKKYYRKSDLKKLTRKEVKLARNEIYARHGRKFTKDMSVKKYFEGKSWYYPAVDEVSDSELNKYEIANRDLIVAYEKKKKWK